MDHGMVLSETEGKNGVMWSDVCNDAMIAMKLFDDDAEP